MQMQGEMVLVNNRCIFRCLCLACVQVPVGERLEMTPNEFELHAGSRSKKWRTSIRAVLPEGGARIPLGKIMEDEGLSRRPSNFLEESGASPSKGEGTAGEGEAGKERI